MRFRFKGIRKRTVVLAIGAIVVAALGAGVLQYASVAHAGAPKGRHNANGVAGSYWDMPQARFQTPLAVTADARTFYIGDTVTMPNGLQLQVTRVEWNWQPSTAQAVFGKTPDGDNPAGREVILVWFTASDVGQNPIEYNNFYFTLQHANQPEQRVAVLSTLPGTTYGSMGKVPWLLPGEHMDTFVPFLITPGEAPESFQYYYYTPSHKEIDRLSVQLKAGSHLTGPTASTAGVYTFSGTQTITVK